MPTEYLILRANEPFHASFAFSSPSVWDAATSGPTGWSRRLRARRRLGRAHERSDTGRTIIALVHWAGLPLAQGGVLREPKDPGVERSIHERIHGD